MTQSQSFALEQRVEALVEQTGGQVPVGDIAGVVTSLMQSLRGGLSLDQLQLRDEVRQLVAYLENARTELGELRPHALSRQNIPDASDELDAIVAATEEAAGKMMDAAEEIEALSAAADGAVTERLAAIVTRIYEASTFQDITGQRITKVVRILQHLEEKLAALGRHLDDGGSEQRQPALFKTTGHPTAARVDGAVLLHGPQLPQAANSQAAIDALLASFD